MSKTCLRKYSDGLICIISPYTIGGKELEKTNNNNSISHSILFLQIEIISYFHTMAKTLIITGGAGFIGSHVVRLFVNKYPDYNIWMH